MKIEKIKKSGRKYKIVLENKDTITTYDDVIINNGLLYNKNINTKTLNDITKETSYYDVYYKCINYITKKLRSEKEIDKYISSLNASEIDKKNTIKKLKEIGYINDYNYAYSYTQDRINLSTDGPLKIRKSLEENDIKEEIIDEVINSIDRKIILDKIKKLIEKKSKNSKYTGYILKQKITSDLIYLGYSKELILEVIDSLELKNSASISKEYEKLYKKISQKYDGSELKNKIKTKLYQKGFSIDEINHILNS